MALLASLSVATRAAAQSKVECADAFTEAQSLRNQLKLRAATERFGACVQDACPAPIRADCAEGLEGLRRDLPTVVVGARNPAGHDLPSVTVLVDGAPLPQDLSGASLPIDPGPHVFTFRHEGFAVLEERVLLRIGERNRSLVVTLIPSPVEPQVPTSAERSRPPPLAPTEAPTSGAPERRRTAGYLVGAAGTVLLAVGVGFGLSVARRCGGLAHEPCDALAVPSAEERERARDALVTDGWIATAGIGVGIAALATAAILVFGGPSPRAHAR